jgi:hypothetical protein
VSVDYSLLKNKYETIIKAIKDMMSQTINLRPTCDKLLDHKKEWALDVNEVKEEISHQIFSQISINECSIEVNFCECFLNAKLKHK